MNERLAKRHEEQIGDADREKAQESFALSRRLRNYVERFGDFDDAANCDTPIYPPRPDYHHPNFDLLREQRKIIVNGEQIRTTNMEYKLLLLMADYENRLVPPSLVAKTLWDFDVMDEYHWGTLRVHLSRLRRRLDPNSTRLQNMRQEGIIRLYPEGVMLVNPLS